MSHSRIPLIGKTYRHWKGGLYEVICCATSADHEEKELVVYRSLSSGRPWVRPLSEWVEDVYNDGTEPRFRLVPD